MAGHRSFEFGELRGALLDGPVNRLMRFGTAPEHIGAKRSVAGALTLAGASGARVTETLTSRAHSSRQKELSEVRAEAEAKSSKLGLPVGMIMMTWVIFIIFPAIQSLLGGI